METAYTSTSQDTGVEDSSAVHRRVGAVRTLSTSSCPVSKELISELSEVSDFHPDSCMPNFPLLPNASSQAASSSRVRARSGQRSFSSASPSAVEDLGSPDGDAILASSPKATRTASELPGSHPMVDIPSTPPVSTTPASQTPIATPAKAVNSFERNSFASTVTNPVGAQEGSSMQSFASYLWAESTPAGKMPSMDVVWRQTERDRVYNFLLYVPYQLERLIQFGLMLCVDSFLGTVVMLPLRFCWAMGHIMCSCLKPGQGLSSCRRTLGGGRMFDVLTFLILLSAAGTLRMVKPGLIYYWLKEMTSEFLKMGILLAAFEISDKILGNFGLDVMEALSGTCMLYSAGQCHVLQVVSDTLVALAIVVLHGLTLMCEGLVLAVALNSKRHGIMALLIASNFAEIKGVVFKRWDIPRIWTLVCGDIVERFHWMAIMLFVLVEDMESSSTWQPSSSVLWECARILASEVVIDVLKHAVLGKFNDVRPGIYREFMKDLCDKVRYTQSHELHKLCGLHHLAVSALIFRILTTLFRMQLEPGVWPLIQRSLLALAMWSLLLVVKPVYGYVLQLFAHNYVEFYNSRYQRSTHHHPRPGPPPAAPKSAGGATQVGTSPLAVSKSRPVAACDLGPCKGGHSKEE